MSDEGQGVLISDGRCSVRLTSNGKARELGYPTVIDMRAGPFQGSILDDLLDYGRFQSQLRSLDGFALDLIGGGTGGVEVRVKAIGEHEPLIQLTFSFTIDQTYLPAIIEQIDVEFPPPYRNFG
jgi:hypothetical protein